MNGEVDVQSEVDKGSTFTIRVELYLDTEENQKYLIEGDQDAKKDYHLEGRHILVAEDNELNRLILCSILTHEGMTYTEAADGEEAFRLFMDAPEYTFDCVLMDMRMPNVDGIKSTMMIRDSGKADANIPIIGVSANGFEDDIKQAKKAGLDGYMTKPIDRGNLMRQMYDLLN